MKLRFLAVIPLAAWLGPSATDAFFQDQAPPATQPANPAPAGRLLFDHTTHDFGRILDTDPVTCTFPFHNAGQGDLTVKVSQLGCGGRTVRPLTKTLYKPGESGEISVTYLPYGKQGAKTARVPVESSDPDNPKMDLYLTAVVDPVIRFDPPHADFGDLDKGQARTLHLSVIGRAPDLALSHMTDGGPAGVSTRITGSTPIVLDDGTTGRRIDLELAYDGAAAPGVLRGTFQAQTSDTRRRSITVSITGRVLGDIELDPPRIPVGTLASGETFERIVHVKNRFGRPFTITGSTLPAAPGENSVTWEFLPGDGDAAGAPRSAYDLRLTITAGAKLGSLRSALVLTTDVPHEGSTSVQIYGSVRDRK